jgi:putative two-component system response regulator
MSVKPQHFLIVDDDQLNCELIEAMLESIGHTFKTVRSGPEALLLLDSSFDLVLLDVMMPVMDGFETAKQIRLHPTCFEVPIIMVTALSEKGDRLRAVESGANDFITKPVEYAELLVRTNAQLATKAAKDALKLHQAELEETVIRRTMDLQQALASVMESQRKTQEAHLDTIHRLALAAEYKDEQTAAHIHRVSHYCAMLARSLGLPNDEVDLIFHAAPMHDVGKIGIPDAILLKPGKLTPDEWLIMKQHTIFGARILGDSASPLLEAGKMIAISHHEKWDGTGYPNGIVGEDIPLHGRICAVADVFDALTSTRHYKEAFHREVAFEMMLRDRGTHFDPHILDIFMASKEEIYAIQAQFPDEVCEHAKGDLFENSIAA